MGIGVGVSVAVEELYWKGQEGMGEGRRTDGAALCGRRSKSAHGKEKGEREKVRGCKVRCGGGCGSEEGGRLACW